jgi:hypothetical protein
MVQVFKRRAVWDYRTPKPKRGGCDEQISEGFGPPHGPGGEIQRLRNPIMQITGNGPQIDLDESRFGHNHPGVRETKYPPFAPRQTIIATVSKSKHAGPTRPAL